MKIGKNLNSITAAVILVGGAFLTGSGSAVSATITLQTPTTFGPASILDISTLSNGALSGTDAFFTDFGISSVSVTGDDDCCSRGTYASSLVGMFASGPAGSPADQLVVASSSSSNDLPLFSSAFTISLAAHTDQFGAKFVGSATGALFEFFDGSTSLGTSTSTSVGPNSLRIFLVDQSFDKIVISLTHGFQTAGISQLWFSDSYQAEVVPVPAALPLFLSGLAGLGVIARRRRKT